MRHLILFTILFVGCGQPPGQSNTSGQNGKEAATKTESKVAGADVEKLEIPTTEIDMSFLDDVFKKLPEDHPKPKDRSLGLAEYRSMGLPDLQSPWLAKELHSVHEVFSKLEPDQLPRFESKRSGVVFEKLTSEKDLKIHQTIKASVEDRYYNVNVHFQMVAEIWKLYQNAFFKKKISDEDFVRVNVIFLRTLVVMAELVDEYRPSVTKDLPDYDDRMKSLAQLRLGLFQIVHENLARLTQRNLFRESQTIALAESLAETTPSFFHLITPRNKIEIKARIRSFIDSKGMSSLKPVLTELIEKLDEIPLAAK